MRAMNKLLLIPSFYAICGFVVPLFLYSLRLISWPVPGFETILIFALFALSNALALTLSFRLCNNSHIQKIKKIHKTKPIYSSVDRVFFYISIFMGIFGYLLYYYDLSKNFGGATYLMMLFVNGEQTEIRTLELETFGTQLTYFSWVASGIISYGFAAGFFKKRWLLIIFLYLILSLGYFDRVKPISILFFSFSGYSIGKFVFTDGFSKGEMYKLALGLFTTVIIFYFGVAVLLGKNLPASFYGRYTDLNPLVANFYMYLTSGYAYFDNIYSQDKISSTNFQIFFYPVFKILSAIGIAEQPPKQALDFLQIPLEVNVATGLEPLYSSFGKIGLILLIVAIPLVFDSVALFLSFRRTIFWVTAITTFAWSGIFLFFTARFVSFPFYLLLFYVIFVNLIGWGNRAFNRSKSQI